jgi:hypothetical protein
MFAAVILNVPTAAQALPPPPTVVFPVSGDFVYLPGVFSEGDLPKSILVDTATSESANLLSRSTVLEQISEPLWNMTGDQIAYLIGANLVSTQSVPSGDLHIIPRIPNLRKIFYPIGWTNGDQALVLEAFSSRPSRYTYYIADATSGELSAPLLDLTEGDAISSLFQLPEQFVTATFVDVWYSELNPTHQDWLLLQIHINYLNAENLSTPELIALAYNYTTQESVFLNDVMGDVPVAVDGWSDDGQFIAIDASLNHHVLMFDPLSASIATPYQHAPARRHTTGEQVEGLLDVQDLLFVLRRTDTELIYQIGQIQAGELFVRDFLIFERPKDFYGLDFAWHLTADEDEQRALSCMFDSAHPTRLAVGAAAQVSFTNGTPLRLRDEPDFDAEEVTQIAEGAAFDVIGGPACVNGESYYRFWQIELADGTIGWAAEADNDDYFMEPTQGR